MRLTAAQALVRFLAAQYVERDGVEHRFFGAAMLGMVQLGIVDAQWDSNWTYTFQGAILFAAVLLNLFVRKRAQRMK